MTGQEARDDVCTEVARIIGGAVYGEPDNLSRATEAADAVLAFLAGRGYRKHPEPEPGVSFDPPYRIEYIDGGDAVLLPFRVIDCAGNVRSLVLTAERAMEMQEAITGALRTAGRQREEGGHREGQVHRVTGVPRDAMTGRYIVPVGEGEK